MCENCPVKCGQCIAEKFNARNLCEKVDPSKPGYNPAYAKLIADKSCGTQEYQFVAKNYPEENIEKHKFPSIFQQIKNLASSAVDHVKSGMKNVTKEEYDSRIAICEKCVFFEYTTRRCFKCGCFMDSKAWLSSAVCPENKWSSV